MSPREREAVWWCTAFRKALQQYRKLPEPWDLELPALPAGPWLGCASTRPRHSGRRTGQPPSPGSLPRWSSRCRCGSSPAGPREQHTGRLLGAHSSRPCRGSDTVAESGTKYWRGYLVLSRWDRLLGGRRPALASERLTFTGLSVAEKASCRAQQASLHISSVNTGPAVTRTYLPGGTVLHSDILLSQKVGPAQQVLRCSLQFPYKTCYLLSLGFGLSAHLVCHCPNAIS